MIELSKIESFGNLLNSLRNVPDVLASTLPADTHAKRIFTILRDEMINNESSMARLSSCQVVILKMRE